MIEKKGRNFKHHVDHCGKRYPCPHCPQVCGNPSSLKKHVDRLHPETQLNRGRPPSFIPTHGAREDLPEIYIPHTFDEAMECSESTGTKRAAEEVLVEPSQKKLLEEDMIIPPPIFQNDNNSDVNMIDVINLEQNDYDSEEEDYFQSQGDVQL